MAIRLPKPPNLPGLPLEERQWRTAVWEYLRNLDLALSGQVDITDLISSVPTTNGLVAIRGIVSAGGVLVHGEGFTSAQNSTGNYTLTWAEAFTAPPTLLLGMFIGGTGSPFLAAGAGSTTDGSVRTYSLATGLLNDAAFQFVAIGERVAA